MEFEFAHRFAVAVVGELGVLVSAEDEVFLTATHAHQQWK